MKQYIIRSIIFASFHVLMTFHYPVFSQATSDNIATDSKNEENIFMSKEIIVRDKRDQPGTTSIITESDVKKSTKSDLINVINENVPSFYSGNNRVMGFGVARSGSAVMSIRGIGKSGWGPTTGVPFLINGLDTTTSIMGHPVADIFKMKNIDRIEVLHGPQPVLYGSGAMGGIVNVITRRQEQEGYSTRISGSYGTYNTTDDYLTHQGKIGLFDYGISYNFQQTDGHREQTISDHKFTSEFINHTGTARFGFELGKHWYAGMNAYFMKQNIHDPGNEGYSSTDLEVFDIVRDGVSLNILNSYNSMEGTIHVFFNNGHHEADKPAQNVSTYEHDDYLYGTRITETFDTFTGNRITLGTDVRRYGGTARDPSKTLPFLAPYDFYYVKDKFLTDISFFGMVEQKFLSVVTLSGGVRYTNNSKFGGFVSWQGGIIANITGSTKLFANAARGFKIPDLRQLYLHGPYPVLNPNPDLDPETYLSFEAGIEQRLFENFDLSVTGYRIVSDNRIVAVGSFPTPSSTWDNLDTYKYNGMETTLKYNLMNMLGFHAGYSFIDNEYKNEKLPYVPRHKFLTGVSFDKYDIFISINGEYIYDIYADTDGNTELDDYFVLNARIAYTFLKRYQAFINLNNITDFEYETYSGYPMPGFTILGGLSVVF